jgi:putative ABC transport system ATP-binding protein
MTLCLDHLTVALADRQLLPSTTRELPAGRLLAVVGASGAGKTTVLSVLAGLAPPAHGQVHLDGTPALTADRRLIGIVNQPVVLTSTLTVAENIGLPLQAVGRPPRDVRDATAALLQHLQLGAVARRLPSELSGGQQQRVAVARAVIGAPRLVVADEPTSELDAQNRDRVLALLRDAATRGASVVIATHDQEVADACDERLDLT